MKKDRVNVLLTCGGGPGTIAHGVGLKKSARYDVRVVVADANAASGNLFLPWVDARYQIPGYTDEDFIPALLRLIKRENIDVIYSGLDEELPLLSEYAGRFREVGCQLLLPPADALKNALDKWLCYSLLDGLVCMPETSLLAELDNPQELYSQFDGKLVIKLASSRGGRYIYFPRTLNEFDCYLDLARRIESEGENQFLLQRRLTGTEYNVSTLHDSDSRLIYAVCRRKFEDREIKSSTTAAVIEKNQGVIDLALTSIQVLRLDRGFNNIEIIVEKDTGKATLLEINGGRSAAQDMNILAAGVNFPEMLLDELSGKGLKPLEHPKDGVAILKIRTDVVVNINDIGDVSVV